MVHVASRDPVQQQMAEVHVHGQVATELPLDGISTYIGTGKFPFPLSPLHFSLLLLPPRIFWAARSCGPSCGPARMPLWRGLQTVWVRRGPLRKTGSSFEEQPLVRLDCCTVS